MESDLKKAALILAVGMVVSALTILLAAHLVSSRMSHAVILAGQQMRSSQSIRITHDTLGPLKVQVLPSEEERYPSLKPEDRERLSNALTLAIEKGHPKIKEVRLTGVMASASSGYIDFWGKLIFDGKSAQFSSRLNQDRFGEFTGSVHVSQGDKNVAEISVRL